MDTFWRLLKAEREKLRRSSCIRMVWFLPLLFILAEFFIFEYKLFGITNVSDELLKIVDSAQIKMAGALWGGFFYPVLIALLPALIFYAEHRNKTWRRLGAAPISQGQVFAAKTVWVVVLSLASLITVWFLLWMTRSVLHFAAPQIQLSFHGWAIAAVLGWLWLGSLPVMAIYLWISNRITSLAVPVVFGVAGVLLSAALTSQEAPEPWKRDFIPWVTPNICVQQALAAAGAIQRPELAGDLFKEEPDIIRLPDGRKIRTWQNIPNDVLFPPPLPTPPLALASFSVVACLVFLILGALDAGRRRKS